MAGFELNNPTTVCRRCGVAYSRLKGYFPVSYSHLYKGTGYLPYCRECVDNMYEQYLNSGHSSHDAVRQMCRKLDIYWNEDIFSGAERTSSTRSMMTNYLTRANTVKYSGKSYDDTLSEDGMLWTWYTSSDLFDMRAAAMSSGMKFTDTGVQHTEEEPEKETDSSYAVTEEDIDFWGDGLPNDMYPQLNKRLAKWTGGQDIADPASVALYRQACILEVTINRDTSAGRDTSKSISELQKVLASIGIKPSQQKDDIDGMNQNTPFGVWIKRWEDERPVPEPDPEFQDVDGIKKYFFTWIYGHLAKMLGIKNAHSQLYEDEINKYRVEHPEYENEDDDDMLYDIFKDSGGADDGD